MRSATASSNYVWLIAYQSAGNHAACALNKLIEIYRKALIKTLSFCFIKEKKSVMNLVAHHDKTLGLGLSPTTKLNREIREELMMWQLVRICHSDYKEENRREE